MIVLRDFQERDMDGLRREFRAGHRSVVYQAPTGTGKTATASYMIARAVARGSRVLFLAHLRELVDQCSQRLDSYGLSNHGIVMAKSPRRDLSLPIQVASIQTLVRRESVPADLIIVDECHHAPSAGYTRLLQSYPEARIIGLTATPVRLDGNGLSPLFTSMVQSIQPAEATKRGYLVPTRVFAPYTPPPPKHVRGGDYRLEEVQEIMDRSSITGDVVTHWLRLAGGRSTIVFCSGVKHSMNVAMQFNAAGIEAEHLDADTPVELRKQILDRLSAGTLKVVTNVGLFTEGVDVPIVSCVVLLRMTLSLSLYLQMIGRSRRLFPGKVDCLVLDHANCTRKHGFADDDREWSLDGIVKQGKKQDDAPHVRLCRSCYAAYDARLVRCPYCGVVPPAQPREIKQKDGELVELDGKVLKFKKLSDWPELRRLQIVAKYMGYKPGWVFRQLERIKAGQKPEIPARAKGIFANAAAA